ncbi:DNA modification methylase [Helicobacter muridarum]|uniref:DNA modification methylase n=1 Tax=Helicobacter muridarum TaxID=216 RepID=A0A099TY10_9HELI|nr:BsaWI family type II restriction enzyme [Helicobacter muridarum]TLD99153.1 DNA modification methylase [Helicobacter muridarum]STQ86887.1 endonuclease MjaVIP [Helicobacter muridarum]
MSLQDLITLYEEMKQKYGKETYKHISQLFKNAKELHKTMAINKGLQDTEQSWRAFKGKNLEKIIEYIIKDEVEKLGFNIINGNKLERSTKLSTELETIKRNLCIDYGEFGFHLPDVDMVIYNPINLKVIAVLSSKVTLRERIAQTGYWKLKLAQSNITKHIKVFFITLDEDETLSFKKPCKKGRAICEIDLDGCYILTQNAFQASNKVKSFEKFIEDLRKMQMN